MWYDNTKIFERKMIDKGTATGTAGTTSVRLGGPGRRILDVAEYSAGTQTHPPYPRASVSVSSGGAYLVPLVHRFECYRRGRKRYGRVEYFGLSFGSFVSGDAFADDLLRSRPGGRLIYTRLTRRRRRTQRARAHA